MGEKSKKVKYIKPVIDVVDFKLFNKQFAKAISGLLNIEVSDEEIVACQRVYLNQKVLSRSSDFDALYLSVLYYCRANGHPDEIAPIKKAANAAMK